MDENDNNRWYNYSKKLYKCVQKNIKDLNLDSNLEVSCIELETAKYRHTILSTVHYSYANAWKVLGDKLEDVLHYIVSLE